LDKASGVAALMTRPAEVLNTGALVLKADHNFEIFDRLGDSREAFGPSSFWVEKSQMSDRGDIVRKGRKRT